MKLVIDIPEKVVTAIQNGEDYRHDINTAIALGTPYEERPTGEWRNCDGEVYCSNCGVECAYDETGYILGRFCHNCGANMRKKKYDL